MVGWRETTGEGMLGNEEGGQMEGEGIGSHMVKIYSREQSNNVKAKALKRWMADKQSQPSYRTMRWKNKRWYNV